MPAPINLIGKRYGKLTVIELAKNRTGYGMRQWLCRCDCGGVTIVTVSNLGVNTNSCGCLHGTQGRWTRKHPLWRQWRGMIDRCNSKHKKCRRYYADRGIAVCERWRSFENFLADMPGHFKGATIDRIDNDKGYSAENCRWATVQQQITNRRCSVTIDTPWGRMNAADAARKIGMPVNRFYGRVRLGWTYEQLFSKENSGVMTRWSRRKKS